MVVVEVTDYYNCYFEHLVACDHVYLHTATLELCSVIDGRHGG